ncbi:Uncharacterised protein [Mycobacteroides abscessus subsp. abscessus]|nr:Uncharacterised protein [Mycobacteroides abscessus subsp. abscessus]
MRLRYAEDSSLTVGTVFADIMNAAVFLNVNMRPYLRLAVMGSSPNAILNTDRSSMCALGRSAARFNAFP